MIVAFINNSHLGKCVSVGSQEEGIDLILSSATERLGRLLTAEEIEEIQNDLEFFNDSDPENIFSICLGEVE